MSNALSAVDLAKSASTGDLWQVYEDWVVDLVKGEDLAPEGR